MKSIKFKDAIITAVFIVSGVITGCGNGNAAADSNTAGTGSKAFILELESLKGITEFKFIPAGDNRTWHVINKYNVPGSGNGPGYNMATYTFSDDSVYVINEYAGIQDAALWDIGFTGFISLNSNFNKKN